MAKKLSKEPQRIRIPGNVDFIYDTLAPNDPVIMGLLDDWHDVKRSLLETLLLMLMHTGEHSLLLKAQIPEIKLLRIENAQLKRKIAQMKDDHEMELRVEAQGYE